MVHNKWAKFIDFWPSNKWAKFIDFWPSNKPNFVLMPLYAGGIFISNTTPLIPLCFTHELFGKF